MPKKRDQTRNIMKSIYMKSAPLLALTSALLLAIASPIASAHPDSRTRIGVGLSLFFPHVGLHLGTSTSGRGHHHDDHGHHADSHGHDRARHEGRGNHNGHARHKGGEYDDSAYRSHDYEAPVVRGGPRSKRHGRSNAGNDYAKQSAHSEHAHGNSHKGSYCDRPDADAARCLSEMQSGR